MILNLNGFYSIFAKKRNSHGHLKCTKKHKIIPRSCCLSATYYDVLTPKIFIFYWNRDFSHCDSPAQLEDGYLKALLYLFCCLMSKNGPSKGISTHCEKSQSYWQECVIAYDNEKELLCCLFGKSFDSEAAAKQWTRR